MRQASEVQDYLEQRAVPPSIFNWGIMVVDAHGVAIASVPQDRQRLGVDFSGYPHVLDVLRDGRTYITDPLFSPHSQQPVVGMHVPIQDNAGRTVGAVIAITNLAAPNFLNEVGAGKYGITGDFVVTAPRSRVYVASSDKRRVMKAGPPPASTRSMTAISTATKAPGSRLVRAAWSSCRRASAFRRPAG